MGRGNHQRGPPARRRRDRSQEAKIIGDNESGDHQARDVSDEEIIGDNESASDGQGSSTVPAGIPELPDRKSLEDHLLGVPLDEAEDYLRHDLASAASTSTAIGSRTLYNGIQLGSELDLVISSAEHRRDALLSYLGIKPEKKKRLHAIFDYLFGLPDAGLFGKEARRFVQNRHGRYAKAIEASRSLGIRANQLAHELARHGGIDGLIAAAQAERVKVIGPHDASDSEAEMGRAAAHDARGGVTGEPARQAVHRRRNPRLQRSAFTPPSSHPDESDENAMTFAIHPEVKARLQDAAGLAMGIIDCETDPPTIVGGRRLPQEAPRQPEEALVWVRAALRAKAAEAQEESTEDHAQAEPPHQQGGRHRDR